MQLTDFSNWFQTNALFHLKQSIEHFSQLMAEQIQMHNLENNPPTKEVPAEYLALQAERCINSFKINLLSELQQAFFIKKFTIGTKDPIDKPIKLHTGNSLMQRAKIAATAATLYSLPQLAFLDIETDGTSVANANILQIAILKPIIDPDHETLSYFRTWHSYVLPWKGYCANDNKAFHVNHIGKYELEKALPMQNALQKAMNHLDDSVVVGYNVNHFDIPILKRHCKKYNMSLNYKYSIDLYPAIWKYKKQKLGDAINLYNLPHNTNPHDALADAACCIDLLSEVIEREELPNNEEELLDLFNKPQNIWQHYGKNKIIEINPDNLDYAHLLYTTPTSSLKRKHSEISIN